MYSRQLTVVSKTTEDVVAGVSTDDNFVVRFAEPFALAGKAADNKGDDAEQQVWEMALIEWRGFNVIDNVNASIYGNNIIEYDGGTGPISVILPDGIYSVDDINAEVQKSLQANAFAANSIVFTAVPSLGKVQTAVAAGFSVNLNASNINAFFGYDPGQSPIVGATTVVGNNQADLTNGIAAYLLRCDAITGSSLNANASDVMYIYTPDVKPGAGLKVSPTYPIFLPVRNNKEIRQIRLYVTDDRGRRVSYREQPMTYLLNFRRVPRRIY